MDTQTPTTRQPGRLCPACGEYDHSVAYDQHDRIVGYLKALKARNNRK